MGFFDSFFGDRNNRGQNRFGDARHDDFLDPRSGFWGDMKHSPTWSFWFKDHGNTGMDGETNPHNGETFQGFEDQMPRQPSDVENELRRHISSFEELFRGVSDMMNGMVPSFPAIQDHQEPTDHSQQSEGRDLTPRDRMLKQPDNDSSHHPLEHPSDPSSPVAPHDPAFPPMAGSLFGSIFKDFLDGFGPQFGGRDPGFNIEGPHIERGGPQVDRDLDDCEVPVDILAPRVEGSNPGQFFSRGFFQSTSVRTYTTGDGITKREVIKRDGMGNEEKEVTETKNGQVISVKTWTTKDGKTEMTESSSSQDHKKFESPLAIQPPFVDNTNSIFGKIFGWSWKSDTKPKDN